MSFFTKLRTFARLRTFFLIAVIGLFLDVVCVFFFVSNSNKNWVSTTATVTNVSSTLVTVGEDDSYEYTVTLDYNDENDVKHTVETGNYSDEMKVGATIEIQYNKEDFNDIKVSSTDWILYFATVIGAIAFVGGTIMTVVELKKSGENNNEFNQVPADYNQNHEPVNDNTNEREDYIFHQNGKLGYNFLLETKNQIKIYEANCNKIGFLFGASKYTFINHITLHQENYDITNTVTESVETGNVSMDLSYYFKINNENCWKHLGNMGYSLQPKLIELTKVGYDVFKGGVNIGYFEMAGTNDIPNAKQYPWGNVPCNIVLKVNTSKEHLDGVFFACFCIAKK